MIDAGKRLTQASGMPLLHASCVEIENQGVLIRGAPGSGKSDLALRLIDAGGRLVADDYTHVSAVDGVAVAQAPDEIAGQIEARGIGVLSLAFLPRAELALVVDLTRREEIERLPDEEWEMLEGVRIRRIRICAQDASAAAKVRLFLASVGDSEVSDDG